MKPLGKLQTTSRGFELIEFKDLNNEACSLQQSSTAAYQIPGSSAVWLGCDKNSQPHHVTKEPMSPRMHLDRKQVQVLVNHLQNWLDSNTFKL